MNKTKSLKGECQHCGRRLDFPAEHIGLSAECPYCHEQTELLLARPPEEPALPRRVLVWTGVAVLVLVLGLAGALAALKRAQRWADRQRPQVTAPAATNGTAGPERPEPGG